MITTKLLLISGILSFLGCKSSDLPTEVNEAPVTLTPMSGTVFWEQMRSIKFDKPYKVIGSPTDLIEDLFSKAELAKLNVKKIEFKHNSPEPEVIGGLQATIDLDPVTELEIGLIAGVPASVVLRQILLRSGHWHIEDLKNNTLTINCWNVPDPAADYDREE